MSAAIRDGWLVVSPYAGPELAQIHIAVAQRPAEEDWRPAFLDYADGVRVAQIRPPVAPGRSTTVWLRVDDNVTRVGKVTL